MDYSMSGFLVLNHFLEFAQTHVHWVADVIQPSHPLLSPSLVLNLSQHQGLFQWAALHIRRPEYSSFSFSISPSNEFSGLISFRIDWFDFLAVQGTLKSLLQHHTSKASILWHLAFFTVQLSHPYMTTGKTIPLTRWTFVGKVMSMLFITLFRFVIAFPPRSKCLSISWLQSSSILILESKKIKWKSLSHIWLFASPWTVWNPPARNTGVGSLSLLWGIFPTQGWNPDLPHCRRILYQPSHKGSPRILEWVAYPFSRVFSWPRNWTGVSCIAGELFLYQLSYEGSLQENKLSHCFHFPPNYLPWNDGTRCLDFSFFECCILSQLFTFFVYLPQEAL